MSCRCFCVILENVCFLLLDVLLILLFSSSSVSSAGLKYAAAVGGSRLVGWLKKEPTGKYIASVFDFLPFDPTCISNPSCLNVLLMISNPLIMSSLVAKRKEPSSR